MFEFVVALLFIGFVGFYAHVLLPARGLGSHAGKVIWSEMHEALAAKNEVAQKIASGIVGGISRRPSCPS